MISNNKVNVGHEVATPATQVQQWQLDNVTQVIIDKL